MIRRLIAVGKALRWAKRSLVPLKSALEESLRAAQVDLPVSYDIPLGVVSIGRLHNITVVPCVDKKVGPDGRRTDVYSWSVSIPSDLYEPYDDTPGAYVCSDHNSEFLPDLRSTVQAATKAATVLVRHPCYSELEQISAATEAIQKANPGMSTSEASLKLLRSTLPCFQEETEAGEGKV